jgi:hypothetical protein
MAATDLVAFKPEPFKQVDPGVIPYTFLDTHLLRRCSSGAISFFLIPQNRWSLARLTKWYIEKRPVGLWGVSVDGSSWDPQSIRHSAVARGTVSPL